MTLFALTCNTTTWSRCGTTTLEEKKASKVRLRRLLSSDSSGAVVGANCDLNIMTYDVDCFGVVTPFDRYGNELVFNEACCAQLGGGEWFFDENTNICGRQGKHATRHQAQALVCKSDTSTHAVVTSCLTLSKKRLTSRAVKKLGGPWFALLPRRAMPLLSIAWVKRCYRFPPIAMSVLTWTTWQFNTSSANRGDVEFGTFTGVVRSQDFVGDKAGSDDQTSRIGDVTPLTVGIETHAVDGALYARVFCGGMEGEWTLDMRATARIIDKDFDFGSTLHAQDDSPMQLQDGTYILMNL